MAHWEYKVLSGGKMGLGSMAMLEQFLNDLGQQQWEVVTWQTDTENPLKFSGLARRPIVRDLAPSEMPAAMDKATIAAAKEEEEKEREAWVETLAREREFYAKAIEAEGVPDDDEEDEERDLVGDLFTKLRQLMKRNKRGPGASGNVAYLAKRLDQPEEDLVGALEEAGVELGDDESDSKPIEQGGDMFWLNTNSRGEVWLNSMPKSRYRAPQPRKAVAEAKSGEPDEKADTGGQREPARAAVQPGPLPEGEVLLEKLRRMMRRNRGNRGLSGSLPFLSRALKHTEEELAAALASLGIALPEDPEAELSPAGISGHSYWLDKNEKGQVWIHATPQGEGPAGPGDRDGDAKVDDATAPAGAAGAAEEAQPTAPGTVDSAGVLALAGPHLTRVGRSTTHASTVAGLATGLGVAQPSVLDALVGAGLEVPVEPGDKPVIVEHDGHRFWLVRGADDALVLNSKPARRPSGRKKD